MPASAPTPGPAAKRYAVQILDTDTVPGSYYFRYDEFGEHSEAPPHSHRWGHLNYAAHGSLNMDVPSGHILCPPQHGVWIPPGVVHSCYLQHAVQYRSVYLAPDLCADLPQTAGCMRLGPIVKAVLADFGARGVQIPVTDADLRLARVVHDQLRATPLELSFLPMARHPALVQVLDAMQSRPDDHRSLAEWAETVHMTERTLARHCQRELGMSLGEWRQRMRYLQAIDALEAGHTVQQIAYDLGYSTPSAFIAMFQRESGLPPEQFRREFCASSF
ncbi:MULTISPECIES: helix-turn-helix transcriptional regulator [Comamonas]|uniref:AraC family transcriptional regulator n=1 Tax=Comamonas sp. wu1-DMT TaxID=3126390 RepID=UPI0015C7B3BE|nr:helix-turn-helix transcriptional regulator [Comamonas thiooxydans]